LQKVLGFAAEQGFDLQGLTFSPITGGEGNIEFLAYWTVNEALTAELVMNSALNARWLTAIDDIVHEAAQTFKSPDKYK
jgi:23S rRNA (cytidine1920-2'-O)/16S rRNA (cytidine1409-2'-O)-methyltransferase